MISQIPLLQSAQSRTIPWPPQYKYGHSKCTVLPRNSSTLRSFTRNYSLKKLMTIQNVSRNSNLQHRNSNRKICGKERCSRYRLSCISNENDQHIADKCTEFSTDIKPGSAVDLMKSKENVSNGKDTITTEEGHAENLSLNAAKDEELEEHSVNPFDLEKYQYMWQQMKRIALFAGPALGIWLCGPLMSLIDTAVIGHTSSLELAALGPGTILSDYLSYVFMFLPIATSNLIASSLARKDEVETQQQLSRMSFVALACGIGMLFLTKAFGILMVHAFVGSKNTSLVPAANTYIQIRGLAWPAVLLGMVAQSASLGMKDSWGPLKVLSAASLLNGLGDIILCNVCGYGIAGAAWATMLSQFVASILMLGSVNKKGYNAFALAVPSSKDLIQIVQLAAPVFISLISRVFFFSIVTYIITSMGPDMLAAHQVMIGVFSMCTIFGEPLSQTAQSFMPALIHGVDRNLKKMHKAIVPFFVGLIISPPRNSLEGSLLAGRDLNFLSYATVCCFCICCLLLLISTKIGLSVQSCWWILACFQWARFSFFCMRLTSFNGPLYDKNT